MFATLGTHGSRSITPDRPLHLACGTHRHPPMNPKHSLVASLIALALLYVAWFANDPHIVAALLVFALPPVALAVATARGWHRAGFTASVLALLWFCHGVMLLWSEPDLRLQAALETVLALAVIHAACLPGIRAWRENRQKQRS